MKVFVTGGAGYIGRAVTRELVAAGHDVTALARSAKHEAILGSLGALPVAGDLQDRDCYEAAAGSADAIVHLAAPSGADGVEALRALLDAARTGAARAFVYTSVLFVLGDTPSGADEESPTAGDLYQDRAALEREVLASRSGRLACSVIRPGMVYGGGEGGTISELFRSAEAEGRTWHIGDGGNRWTLVHRSDVASLFRLVIEKRASGIFHATDEAPLPAREIAQLAAAAAGAATVESIEIGAMRKILGRFADALSLDQPVRSPRARALGWQPHWPPFRDSAAAAFTEFKRDSMNRLSRHPANLLD